jgi:imidazolonepropionase-like amidohydrolase
MAMSRTALVCLVTLASAVTPASAQERPPPGPGVAPFVAVDAPVVALAHARLVDGTGAPALDDQTIVVQGTTIAEVGPSVSVAIPEGATVLDLTGHTLLPGLVDLHQHTWFGGVRQSTQMETGPLLYLAMGVTTAMTAGSQFPYHELNQKRAIDAGLLPGPRTHVTGPYLTSGPPRPSANRIVQTPEEVRRVVSYWADEGATWFKFLGTGTTDLLAAAIEVAHARGLRVTGHLCSITFSEAARLGIDALQHGFITNSDYVLSKEPGVCPPENMRVQADVDVESPEVRRNIADLVAMGAPVVSTLGVYETFMPDRARLDPRALAMLRPGTRAEVEANQRNLVAGGLIVPPRLFRKMMRWERLFVEAGGLLGAGSDPWGTGFLPGFGNLRNVELLVEAGFTFEEAIRITTLNGARILGEDAQVGSITVGKRADLVVVRGDPVSSPSSIYDVVTVFKGGLGFDSSRLRAAVEGTIGPS